MSLILFFIVFILVIGKLANRTSTKNLTKEDLKTFIPENQILFDEMIFESPDGKNYAFLTVNDLGMRESYIWIVSKTGRDIKNITIGSGYRSVTSPVWSEDGKKLAFLRIYPFELWVLDLDKNVQELIYSESDHLKDNLLNPSLGFLGQTDISWHDNESIEFTDNKALPPKRYSINIDTKEIERVAIDLSDPKDETDLTKTNPAIPIYSQRDPLWANKMLGTCEKQTLESAGCTISTVAMVLNYFGVKDNPVELNSKLTSNLEGYFNGCDVRWNMIPNLFRDIKLKGAYFNEYNLERLDYELEQGNPVIIGYDSVPYTKIPHWILVTHKKDGQYYVNDPWSLDNKQKTLQDFTDKKNEPGGEFDHMIVYERINRIQGAE